jgi:hypothetical protein
LAKPAAPARVETVDTTVAANEPDARDGAIMLRWIATTLAWVGGAVLVAVLARSDLYTSGEGVGYAMGIVGGVAMLILLLYPLRKRVRGLAFLGRLRDWFAAHMLLGIFGPVLILLHSTLRLGSMNAKVAFWCMVVVATSGIAGRYMYARLHRGLYGRQQTLAEVRAEAATLLGEAERELGNVPKVAEALKRFAASAEQAAAGPLRAFKLSVLPLRGFATLRECRALLGTSGTATAQGRTLYANCRREVSAAVRAAQFRAVERLFALWHVLHLPLVFIMVITAIIHIIAVHMY